MNVGRLVQLHKEWTRALPKVHPFYAVKSNDDPVILKMLANLGTGFDCASKVSSYTCTCIIVQCILPISRTTQQLSTTVYMKVSPVKNFANGLYFVLRQ